ncbi:MAG: two-component regulator propeller domain-containing protein [Saprospiraceae bacterium]|nr:two-component regulator propeller domain-containing protein [Saprospiraceae bacterium]
MNTWSIIQDRNENIWIGGGDGLWRSDGSSFTKMANDFVICVYEDKKRNIWTTSPAGNLTRYDDKGTVFRSFQGDGPFLGITEDKEGNIWFGGGDGLWRYYGKTVTYFTSKQKKDS